MKVWDNPMIIQMDNSSPGGKIPPTQFKVVQDLVVRGLTALDR